MSRTYYVLTVSAPDTGMETHEIREEAYVLGRSKVKADLRLNDPKISGRHCELRFVQGALTVTDLGSTNGTLFEGKKRADGFALAPGARFRIGDSWIELVAIHGLEAPKPVAGAIAWGSEEDVEEDTRALSPSELYLLKTNPPEIAPEAELLDPSFDEPLALEELGSVHDEPIPALPSATSRSRPPRTDFPVSPPAAMAPAPPTNAPMGQNRTPPAAHQRPPGIDRNHRKNRPAAVHPPRSSGQPTRPGHGRVGPRPGVSTFKASFKYLVTICGLAGVTLSIVFKVWENKPYGIAALVACAVPAVLSVICTVTLKSFPRWAALITVVAFSVAILKTNISGNLHNIMLVSTIGMLLGVFLLVSPDRRWD